MMLNALEKKNGKKHNNESIKSTTVIFSRPYDCNFYCTSGYKL